MNSIRNINTRDEKAKATRQPLRKSEAKLRKLSKVVENLNVEKSKLENVASKNKELKNEINLLKANAASTENTERRKLNAQKSASYCKMKANNLREKLISCQNPSSESIDQLQEAKER